jgi:5-methylcytosine-specific restriction endonuclease McrA
MKKKTSKLAKLERNRFSIFTDDLDTCMFCGRYASDLNEVFRGRNRQNSMRYGAVQPLCRVCHNKITNNVPLENEWKKKGQKAVMKHYKMTKEEFIEIFGMNYI